MQNQETKKLMLKERKTLDTKPEIIAAGCPFCMLTDGIKTKRKRMRDGHCRINCKCSRFIEL
jgi:Fe-S oxidoreductase